MKRIFKVVTAIVCMAAICLLSVGCGERKVRANALGAPDEKKVGNRYVKANDEEYKEFKEKVELFAAKFGSDYYSDSDKNGNYVCSPVSIYLALALAAECTRDSTREEILSTLGVNYEELQEYAGILSCSLNKNTRTAQAKVSNSIWLDDSLKAKQKCIDNLADNFYCYSYSTDFDKKNRKANKAIRDFINNRTYGLIDKDFNLGEDTAFALINTIFVKDNWFADGSERPLTENQYTFKGKNEKVTTSLMQGHYIAGRAYEGEGYTSFYTTTNTGYKLYFMVPKSGYSVDDIFTENNIKTAADSSNYAVKFWREEKSISEYNGEDSEGGEVVYEYMTRCLYPSFNANGDGDVKNILKKEGVIELFDMSKSNFGNLTDDKTYCSEVKHVAKFEVDRRGLKGAAATVIPGLKSSAFIQAKRIYCDFTVDRAFGFILTDEYGTTLFSGVVNDI